MCTWPCHHQVWKRKGCSYIPFLSPVTCFLHPQLKAFWGCPLMVMPSSLPLCETVESKGQPGSSSAVSCCMRHPWESCLVQESSQNTYLGCSHTPCTTRYFAASQRLGIKDHKWCFCCAMGRKQGVTDITSVLSPCSDREFSQYRRSLETSWSPSRRGDRFNWNVGDECTR